jgi:hypothetical protein
MAGYGTKSRGMGIKGLAFDYKHLT